MRSKLWREVGWRGPEFLYKKKTPLWYANVGVFFFLVFLALLWAQNIFGLAVSAFAFWYFLTQADTRPRVVDYRINQLGVHIEDRLVHFESLTAFEVEKIGPHMLITLSPLTVFSFPITLVAKDENTHRAVELLLEHLPRRPVSPLLHRLTHWLGY